MNLAHRSENSPAYTNAVDWCVYCFGALDPEDRQPNLREFIQCTGCQRCYHAACWQVHQQCIKCGTPEGNRLLDLARLPACGLAQPVRASSVKPSAVFFCVGQHAYAVPPFVLEHVAPQVGGWHVRTKTNLQLWDARVKAETRNRLRQFAQQLLVQDPDSELGKFIQFNLDTVTLGVVYALYAILALLCWLLLRLMF